MQTRKFNKPQQVLFSISMLSLSVFTFASISTLMNGKVEKKEESSVLGLSTISDKRIRLNYYVNNDYKNPLIDEAVQGNLISAYDQKVLVELKSNATLACNDCSFIYSDDFGLSILNGVGYIENNEKESIELVFEREVLSITPNTKLIYDYENKEVYVVSGVISNRNGEIIEKDQKYIFLVDKFYLRESDLNSTENSSIKELAYFLYDINKLPAELNSFQPEI